MVRVKQGYLLCSVMTSGKYYINRVTLAYILLRSCLILLSLLHVLFLDGFFPTLFFSFLLDYGSTRLTF